MDSLEILQRDYEARNSDDSKIAELENEFGMAPQMESHIAGVPTQQADAILGQEGNTQIPGQSPAPDEKNQEFAYGVDPELAQFGEDLANGGVKEESAESKDGITPLGGVGGKVIGPSQKEFSETVPRMLRPFFGDNTRGEFNTQAMASISDAIQETGNAFIDIADLADDYLKKRGWTSQEFITKDTRMDWVEKSFPAPVDTVDKAARALTKYAVGVGAISKYAKGATTVVKMTKGVTAAAAFNFLAIDPKEERLSNMIAESGPDFVAPYARLLATEADDAPALSRFKNAMESMTFDVALAGVASGVGKMYRGMKSARRAATAVDDNVVAIEKELSKKAAKAAPPESKEEIVSLITGDSKAKFPFKVNVDRLTDVEDLGTLIKSVTAKNLDEIQKFRGGTVGKEEIKKGASEIISDPEAVAKLMTLGERSAVTPEQKLTIDALYSATSNEFLNFIKKYDPVKATTVDKARYIELHGAMTRLQKISHATSAEWGRTGQAMQAVKEMPSSIRAKYVSNLVQLGGKTADEEITMWKKVAEMGDEDFMEVSGKVIQKSFGMKMTDALVEYQRNSLLSSARTLMTNVISPVITTGQGFIETGIAYAWSKAGLIKKPVGGGAAGVPLAEVTEYARAYVSEPVSAFYGGISDIILQSGKEIKEEGMVQAFKNNKDAAKAWFQNMGAETPERAKFGSIATAMETRQPAITAKALGFTGKSLLGINLESAVDAAGAIIRTPSYTLAKTDQASGQIIYNIRKRALAAREIASRGIDMTTPEGKKQLGDLLMDVDAALVDKPNINDVAKNINEGAIASSKQDRFVSELEGWMATVNDFVNGKFFPESAYPLIAITKTIAPFARVSLNMASYGFERIPGLALVSSRVRSEIAAGGARQAMAQAKMTTGLMYMSLGGILAHRGIITGNGPRNPEARKLREDSGWMAKSFKVGDTYYDLNKVGAPLTNFLTFAADMADMVDSAYSSGSKEYDKIMAAAAYAFTDFVTPELLTRDLSGFLDLLNPENQGKEIQQLFNQFAASLVPTVSKDLRKQVDPYKRETWVDKNHFWPGLQEAMNKMKEKLPYLSESLPPRRNMFGEPVDFPPGFGWDVVSPVVTMKQKKDLVYEEMIRLGVAGNVYHPEANEGEQHLVVRMPSKSVKYSLGGQTLNIDLSPEEYDKFIQLSAGLGLKGAGKTLHQALADEIKNDYPSLGSQKNIQNKRIMINKIISKYREAAKGQLVQTDANVVQKFYDAKQNIVNVRSALEEPAVASQTGQ